LCVGASGAGCLQVWRSAAAGALDAQFAVLNSSKYLSNETQVRQSISAAVNATKQRLGLPAAGSRPGAWATLTPEQLRARLEAAEARQRAMTLQMSPTQWEVEKRCVRVLFWERRLGWVVGLVGYAR